MNKQDLVNVVAAQTGESKAAVTRVIESLTNVIPQALKNSDTVTLVGFGTFKTVDRVARSGRNPRTGEVLAIPAKRAVKFVAGKEFRETV